MTTISVKNKEVKIEIEEWERRIEVENGSSRIVITGNLRFSENDVKLYLSNKNIYEKDFEHKMVCSLNGEYSIIIINNETIDISLSYSAPHYIIRNIDGGLILSQSEEIFLDKGINKDQLRLRANTKQGFFMPLGVVYADDVLLPGMALKYNKYNMKTSQKWFMPIHEIATEDDIFTSTDDIANEFVNELKTYRHETVLQLSSGVDSALICAAAKVAEIDITSVNFKPSGKREGESSGAKKIAKYFNIEHQELYDGPSVEKELDINTNITDYLNESESLLKTGSGLFTIDNLSLLLPYYNGYKYALEGSAYPTALCIAHYTEYPSCRFKKMNPLDFSIKFKPMANSGIRYKYSYEYQVNNNPKSVPEELIRSEIRKKYNIHEGYHYLLRDCYYGSSRQEKLNLFLEVKDFISLEKQKYIEQVIERGNLLVEKILLIEDSSNYFESYTPEKAQALQKIIVFINNCVMANSKLFNTRKSGLYDESRPGLASNVLFSLLKVKVDQSLVGYPKKHIFKAFEKLAGKSFFEINKISPSSVPISYTKKLVDTTQRILKTKNNYNKRSVLMLNKSIEQYLKNQDVYIKYRDLGLNDIVDQVEFSRRSISTNNELNSNIFWKLNSVHNIASLIK